MEGWSKSKTIACCLALFISPSLIFASSCGDEIAGAGNGSEAVSESQTLVPHQTEVEATLSKFEFPEMANLATSDKQLRGAIYQAFGGKCFYSGQPITPEEMVIDHIVPKSLGGPDNFFNYVPTIRFHNSKKLARFDPMAASVVLSFVRTVYAPKVQMIIEDGREKVRRDLALKAKQAAQKQELKKSTSNNRREPFATPPELIALLREINLKYPDKTNSVFLWDPKAEWIPAWNALRAHILSGQIKIEHETGKESIFIKLTEKEVEELFGKDFKTVRDSLLWQTKVEVLTGRLDRKSFMHGFLSLVQSVSHARDTVVWISKVFVQLLTELDEKSWRDALDGKPIEWPFPQ